MCPLVHDEVRFLLVEVVAGLVGADVGHLWARSPEGALASLLKYALSVEPQAHALVDEIVFGVRFVGAGSLTTPLAVPLLVFRVALLRFFLGVIRNFWVVD